MVVKATSAIFLATIAIVLASTACGSDEPAHPQAIPPTATPGLTPVPDSTSTEPTSLPTQATPESTPAPPSRDRVQLEEDAPHADQFAEITLASIIEEFGTGAENLEAHAFPLERRDRLGELWAVITNGPQPFYINEAGEGINFFHLIAVYRLNDDASWSEQLDALEIESAPHRISAVAVHDLGISQPSLPVALSLHGQTGAHAGTLDLILLEDGKLRTAISHISARPNSGEVVDLDGDGVPEVILNDSNPYVFCYACAVEERRERIYRWDGSSYRRILLEPPTGLPSDLAAAASRVVDLANADLWREAASLATDTSRQDPDNEGLRWLSTLVNRTAVSRLSHMGSPGQPLLTAVLAGEYERALDQMRLHLPADVFALDGPLIVGTAAETDLAPMADTILGYSERAIVQRPDDPAIHAVRSLGLVLASPGNLHPARMEVERALELAPGDSFLQQAKEYLDSVDGVPGTEPDPPGPEEFYDGPGPAFFEDGEVLGSGDRGIFVRALKQRLVRVATLGFDDPGRYHDIFDEATREAVIKLQVEAELPPVGFVNGPTWEALERLVERGSGTSEPDTSPEPTPLPATAHGEAGEPIIYLTFDDGPHPTYTPQVLEVLARYDAIATFFVLGASVTSYPELAARIVEAGHDAENHTFDHASLDRVDRATFIAEVEDTDQAIEEATDGLIDPTTSCLRPPYGAVDDQTNVLAAELGKDVILWDVDPQDWRRPGTAKIASHLIDNAHPGAVLLMHDGGGPRSQTVEALDVVLRELSTRGYTFGLLCR